MGSLRSLADDLLGFHERFKSLFHTRTRDVSACAADYLCGLFQARTRNIERMEEAVPDSDYEAMQHFISESPWSHEGLVAAVGRGVDERLGGTPWTALLIDETGFVKKGHDSVGVARQYLGRTRRVENCQVAVFAVLSAGDRAAPVDFRLFLPESWTGDSPRCERAGVPADRRRYRSKPQLALELVRAQVAQGRRFVWVGADALYGHSLSLREGLEGLRQTYVVEIPSSQRVYLSHPAPAVPAPGGRGRPPSRPRAQRPAQRVDAYALGLGRRRWERLRIRETTGAPLVIDFHRRRVWTWETHARVVRRVWLLVRRDPDGTLHYGLSNAPAQTSSLRLARMFTQRYWIERDFEDAKGEAGLAQYQVRGWRAWHHHVAMVVLAMLFLLEQRMLHRETVPWLSAHDIRELLRFFLQYRGSTEQAIFEQLRKRHAKRQAATASKRRRAVPPRRNLTK